MDSRDKILKALNHEEGPLPVDFDSTAVTGIHVSVVKALRDYYGLTKGPVKVWEPYQMLGLVEDDLKEALGIDTEGLKPPQTLFGFPNENWKQWKTPWQQVVLVPEKFEVTQDCNGCYIHPQGDKTAAPSGHLPNTGYFFDAIIRQPPIDDNNLNPEDNLEEFSNYTDQTIEYYKAQIDKLDKHKAVIATFPGTAFGDIALVPAPFLKNPKGIRDVAEWYISTGVRQDYIHSIFEKQLEYAIKNLDRINTAIGSLIDVVFICGTDFGTQSGTFCSVESFNNLWKPYYKALNDWIHTNTTWRTFKHSCGSIFNFIEPLIQAGFDILNPVQCSAAGMEPGSLKDKFGDRIVFWGGGVDTQQTLPFGTPEQVKRQVFERCEIFSKNGGFVFNTIHNIQAKTPVENLIAMFEGLKEFKSK
jgi:hypothetical protein